MQTNIERRKSNAERRRRTQRGAAPVRGSMSGVRCSTFLFLLLLLGASAHAQNIQLKTGQTIETQSVRRDGDIVLGKVQVGTGSGEVGYHLAQIAKIDFPEPAALKAAANSLGQGDPQKALGEIAPVVAYYASFKELPGAWWTQAALIKMSALAALQKDTEAEALAGEIQKVASDPETTRLVQLRLAQSAIRKRDFDKALAISDSAIKDSADPGTLATAWLTKGDVLFARREWGDALLAYLHVPVFFQDERASVPPALLGSARSYRRLDDNARAKQALNELITQFPQSAEAAAAQNELKKL